MTALIGECEKLAMDNITLQSRVSGLEQDIKALIKALNQFRGYNSDFDQLKQKHQIY
jgi:hypothetical protein